MTWAPSIGTLLKCNIDVEFALANPINQDELRWIIYIRDRWQYQNGCFRKRFKGERGYFQSKSLYCRFWTFIQGFKQGFSEKLQYKFLKMEGGVVKGCLEFFSKIHLFWYCHPSLNQGRKTKIKKDKKTTHNTWKRSFDLLNSTIYDGSLRWLFDHRSYIHP